MPRIHNGALTVLGCALLGVGLDVLLHSAITLDTLAITIAFSGFCLMMSAMVRAMD